MRFVPEADDWLNAIHAWHAGLTHKARSLPLDASFREAVAYKPMHYFSVLSRLKPAAGQVLDWVYTDTTNGWPLLYWRQTEEPHFSSPAQVPGWPGRRLDERLRHPITAMVQTDDSPEGWLQLVMLRVLAGNTLLRWHAYYQHVTVVFNHQHVRDWVWGDGASPFACHMDADAQKAVLAMDIRPSVDLSDPLMAKVELTRFSPWGGLFRSTWAANRREPHELRLAGETPIMAYQTLKVL